MSVLPVNKSPKLTPALLTTLEECSEKHVFSPGYVQPHGVLLRLQAPQLKIVQVSDNAEHFLGVAGESLLGQPLQQLFPRTQVKRITDLLKQGQLQAYNPFELKTQRGAAQGDRKRKTQTFRGTFHQTLDALILELEPASPIKKDSSIFQTYHRLQTAILKFRRATNLLDLANVLTKEVKALTGFDRVMVYCFGGDNHGVVIAEEKESHLESYLGLHYPATDIPTPARQLFLRNWVRQIPDVNYVPSRLISVDKSFAETSLDLSDCVLRGVSPFHIEYLQNMGVASSLTISLIDDQHLWGLISCHHSTSKLVDYETRKTCEFLGQFASIELVHQQERELDIYRAQVKTIQDKLQQAFLKEPNFIQQVLTRNATELLNLVHANGVAIALDQQISLVGQTPTLEEVQHLLSWLPKQDQPEVYVDNCLPKVYPPAKKFSAISSGILAISIVLHQKSYYLIWFRSEQIQTVNWAGNPMDAVTVDDVGALALCPRKSFELWKETVQETSLPWEKTEIEAALMMRSTLMLAMLEFSQAALEQAAERAAIANRAKSQFLAKMSHELRTPLNAILGFTQVMNRSSQTPSEFQEHLGIINRSGEHLLTLINDVLEMSRIEAGQMILSESCFNLFWLLRSIQEMFALKASEKGILLKIEQVGTIPHYICGDEAKLRQILINLLSNAIKFTQHGEVTLRVSVVQSPSTAEELPQDVSSDEPVSRKKELVTFQFAVKDTGCGIAISEQESIFEAFMQTERGRHGSGTGLGLSISRQFARLMGGDITVSSHPNQGSIFTCQLVLHLPSSLDLVSSNNLNTVVGLEPGQPSYRILVAEDVLENQQLMLILLKSIGFEVKTAKNGAEAIAEWKAWQPHLIFMDIEMPVMSGYEATEQIRAQEVHDQRQPVPIIALTAYAFESDRLASFQAGCNDHIAKPFTETAIFEAIAHHLGVRYHYIEKTASEFSVFGQELLTPQHLKVMPAEWIANVHEAALDLNDGRIMQLIAEIPQQEKALFDGITHLVNNFQLEAIATLTQP